VSFCGRLFTVLIHIKPIIIETLLRNWLVWLLSFKRPLLSVDVSVFLSVGLCLFVRNLETKRFRVLCPIKLYRKVSTARRLVTSLMTL